MPKPVLDAPTKAEPLSRHEFLICLEHLGMTQVEFARRFHINKRTVCRWGKVRANGTLYHVPLWVREAVFNLIDHKQSKGDV